MPLIGKVQVQEAELLDLLHETNDIAPNEAMTAIGKNFFIIVFLF